MTRSVPPRSSSAQNRAQHEDPDRKPGGFPHSAIAMTAGFVIVIAGLLLYGLIKQSLVMLVVCALLVPVFILVLRREASKERDAIHPSR